MVDARPSPTLLGLTVLHRYSDLDGGKGDAEEVVFDFTSLFDGVLGVLIVRRDIIVVGTFFFASSVSALAI